MWQWYNFLESQAPTGFKLLRLNLDETSVKLFQGDQKGICFFKKKRPREPSDSEEGAGEEAEEGDGAPEPVQKVNLQKKRTCLTHVGLICDQSSVQPFLPQVLIGNEKTFLQGDMDALKAACPANVVLVRQKSAWSNVQLSKRVFRLLAEALRKYEREQVHPPMLRLQPVLSLDAANVHIHEACVRSCYALDIWPIVVPARLTWLLQPLDTHAFQKYKEYFKAAYQRARLLTADGVLTVSDFLNVFYDAIRRVLQGNRWALAFDQDGFGPQQAKVSSYILQQLQLEEAPVVPSTLPALETLQHCFPRNRAVPLPTMLVRTGAQQLALPAPAAVQTAQLVLQGPASVVARPVGPLGLRRRLGAPVGLAASGAVTRSQTASLAAGVRGPSPRPPPSLAAERESRLVAALAGPAPPARGRALQPWVARPRAM